MGVSPKWALQKSKFSTFFSWTHEIFMVSKYKVEIKFDQIWRFQNGRFPSNKAAKIQNFLTIHVRHMKLWR